MVLIYRSSHRRYSVKKGVLRNFEKFTGKHLCQSHFFNKVVGRVRPPLLEIITERGSQKFYKSIDVHFMTNAIDEIEISMIFLVVTCFVGR